MPSCDVGASARSIVAARVLVLLSWARVWDVACGGMDRAGGERGARTQSRRDLSGEALVLVG